MKNLFTLGVALTFSVAAWAQNPHVFNVNNGPKNPSGTDTVHGTVLTSVPLQNIVDCQWCLWDLTQIVYGSYKYYATFGVATGFPSATHYNNAYVDILPGVKYQSSIMFAIENSGIKLYGERMAQQTFSLAAQTGNPSDKVVIDAQDVKYSAPQVQMAYPATIGSKWNSTSNATTTFKLTYTPPSPLPPINNQPGERRSVIVSSSEVVGWGSMRVRRLDGKPSGSKPVLEVKNTLSVTDSFYLNGTPVPAALLTQIGLQQGETRIAYQKSFYRSDEMLPLVNVRYKEASFTTVEDVNVHAARLPYPDNVNDVDRVLMAEIYPNPAKGIFTVQIPGAENGNWSYTLTDITGKKITAAAMPMNNGKAVVDVTGSVIPGTYLISFEKESVPVCGKKIVIQ